MKSLSPGMKTIAEAVSKSMKGAKKIKMKVKVSK